MVRVDSRLVHGQVMEAWVPKYHIKHIIVSNDAMSQDAQQQMIISLAIPHSIQLICVSVSQLTRTLEDLKGGQDSTLVLFANLEDVWKAVESGTSFSSINLGNLHYASGKCQISPSVSLGKVDYEILEKLHRKGIRIDLRAVPMDNSLGFDDIEKYLNKQEKHSFAL